jgi:hypothetical protein
MANGTILLSKTTGTTASAAVTFASTKVVITDSAGAAQSFSLTGVESPPWTVAVTNLAAGAGTIVATDTDTTGAAIGSPVTQPFTTGAVTGNSFPQTTGITFSPS